MCWFPTYLDTKLAMLQPQHQSWDFVRQVVSGDSRMKKMGDPLRGQGKSRGANINVKYCWPKVICCMGLSSELERKIKQKTGGARGVGSQKYGGAMVPPGPPLESPLQVACS